MISAAAVATAGEHPGACGAWRPEPLAGARQPERSRPQLEGPGAAARGAAHRLERGSGCLVHQLMAAAPELGPPPPSRRRMHAADEAHLAGRIRYSGPVMPVDLRV
jgi:hypothetical protein